MEDALSAPLVDTSPLAWDYRGTREKMTLPFGDTLRYRSQNYLQGLT